MTRDTRLPLGEFGVVRSSSGSGKLSGVVFIADDLGAWLVGALADASRKRLTALLLGTEQERALRSAATEAVKRTAGELCPDDDEQAGQLAMVISEVFGGQVPSVPRPRQQTLLETLRMGIAGQLAVLDDAGLTGIGHSSAEVLGVPGAVLADKLTIHLVQEIRARGAQGGPLFPLASQLNADVTHQQGLRLERLLEQIAEPAEPHSQPLSFPAQLRQQTVPLSDGLHAGTLLAIEIQAHRELEQATVVMTGISGPPRAATIQPPARLYWHPSRQVSPTIARGASNFINVARVGPLPPGAVMDTPDLDHPWALPDGMWQIELQLTATGYPALAIAAAFKVSPADGFPIHCLEWLGLTISDHRDVVASPPGQPGP